MSSPLAAPLSTSTPIEHWPPTGKGEVDAEEPPLLLKAVSQKESVTPAPNTGSSASGPPFKHLTIPVQKGTEESSGGETRETGTGKEAGSDESGKNPMRQHEEHVKVPVPEQHWAPSLKEVPYVPSGPSLRSSSSAAPAEKSPTGGKTDSGRQSRSFVEKGHDGGMARAGKEAAPPLQEEEAASLFDSIARKHEEIHSNAGGGEKKVKKRVSFSEQLFVEEETEKRMECEEEEDESHPQQLTREGPVAGDRLDADSPECPHTEGAGQEPVTTAAQPIIPAESGSFSEDPTSEASPARGTRLWRVVENDGLTTQYQSKASDHEGLLSDPLSDLPSASDVKSPIMADLSLSLPSIPEVASDDERVDEAGDGGEAGELVDSQAGVSSLNMSPSGLEKAEGLSGRARESVLVENLHDFRPESPRVAPSEQTAALGIAEPRLGERSSVKRQFPGPGTVEEEELEQSGRPGSPLRTSQGSPTPSPPPSEVFPAAHSLPSSPHSNDHHTSVAESQIKATPEGSAGKVENFGKKKPLLQAWVTPSEIHPVSAQPSAGAGAAKHR